jgi:hypothetical protein
VGEQLERREALQHARLAQPAQHALGRLDGGDGVTVLEGELAEADHRAQARQRALEQRACLVAPALAQAQLAELHRGPAGHRRAHGPQVLERTGQLLLGRRPVPAPGEHRAVGGAAGPEEVACRPRRRERVHGARPLRRAREVADVRAAGHRVAQRPPGRDGVGELLGDDERARLVEMAHALLDVAAVDERRAEHRGRDASTPDVADLARQGDRLARHLDRRSGSGSTRTMTDSSSRIQPELRARLPALERRAGASEPRPGDHVVAAEVVQVRAQPGRGARRAAGVPGLAVGAVGALAGADGGVLVALPPGRPGQALPCLGVVAVLERLLEVLGRARPRALGERGPAGLQHIRRSRRLDLTGRHYVPGGRGQHA